jgi:hypothetical protein
MGVTSTEQLVEEVNKPSVYWDEGLGRFVYRASALYSCPNILMAFRLGMEGASPPEWMQERYDEGHAQEALILDKLVKKHGFVLYATGDEQMTVEKNIGTTAMVRGHTDALSAGGEVEITSFNGVPGKQTINIGLTVIDAKALAPEGYKKWVAHNWRDYPYYLWQQSFYVHGLDADGLVMAVKNKVTGAVDVAYWERAALAVTMVDIVKSVMVIEKRARDMGNDALMAVDCDPLTYPCPFHFLHDGSEKKRELTVAVDDVGVEETPVVEVEGEVPTAPTGPTIAELKIIEALAREVTKFDKAEKAAKDSKEGAKERLAEALGRTEATVALRDFTVTTYYSGGSKTDWEGIAQAIGGEPDAIKTQFTSTTKSANLSVKVTPVKKETKPRVRKGAAPKVGNGDSMTTATSNGEG